MAELLKIWKTKDNRQFYSKEEAEKHEEILDFFENCKKIFCDDICNDKECEMSYEMRYGEKILTTDINTCECSKSHNKNFLEEMLVNYKYLKNYFEAIFIKESHKDKVFKEETPREPGW